MYALKTDFPSEEEIEMKNLFQEIFEAEVSFNWRTDLEKVRILERLFTELDREIIRPWVKKAC